MGGTFIEDMWLAEASGEQLFDGPSAFWGKMPGAGSTETIMANARGVAQAPVVLEPFVPAADFLVEYPDRLLLLFGQLYRPAGSTFYRTRWQNLTYAEHLPGRVNLMPD